MTTKTEKARQLWISGDKTGTLRLFKSFKLGITPDEKRTLEIAHEVNTGKANFYETLGIDTKKEVAKAYQIIENKFNH